jgi:hypothetical protein
VSELISGKEALIALANDQEVEYFDEKLGEWVYMDMTHHFKRDFRLKPRTITINNIEVPATFEPKNGEMFFYLNDYSPNGFGCQYKTEGHSNYTQFGAWRTESEIKQVVAALREVFK